MCSLFAGVLCAGRVQLKREGDSTSLIMRLDTYLLLLSAFTARSWERHASFVCFHRALFTIHVWIGTGGPLRPPGESHYPSPWTIWKTTPGKFSGGQKWSQFGPSRGRKLGHGGAKSGPIFWAQKRAHFLGPYIVYRRDSPGAGPVFWSRFWVRGVPFWRRQVGPQKCSQKPGVVLLSGMFL